MRVEIVTITPGMAEEMLAHNFEGNRHVRRMYVRQLAGVMRDGRFVSQNGQTIVIGEDDGVLYDGQHRLMAIVESGCEQTLAVAYVTNGREAYTTIDNGTRRKAADFINLPSKGDSAAIAKMMACVEWGDAPLVSSMHGYFTTKDVIDRGLIVAYAEQHGDEITDAVRTASKMSASVGRGARSVYGFFVMLLRYCETDIFLEEYVAEFLKAASKNETVTAAKTQILKAAVSARTATLDKKWLLGILLNSYDHFCKMDGSTMFNKGQQRINQYSRFVQQRRDELAVKGGGQ